MFFQDGKRKIGGWLLMHFSFYRLKANKLVLRLVFIFNILELYFYLILFNLDYILAYQKDPNDEKSEKRRDIFEKNLEKAGLQLEREDNTVSDNLRRFSCVKYQT